VGDEEYLAKLIPLVSTSCLIYDMADGVISHVHAFPFSVQRSKNVVPQSYKFISWVLVRHLASLKWFRNSWQTIGTPSRWHCM
jgi:hypothetical protein